jgi:DNA adenine methylase
MRKAYAAVMHEDPTVAPLVRARPFLKWAGGKWAIADQIKPLLPYDLSERVYREPFLGGGAMFFYLERELTETAVLTDSLADLVTTYKVVREHADALLTHLEQLRRARSPEHFYEIRTAFNQQRDAAPVERAAWLIYLNKTCYNGLFRTNQSGAFNVPIGRFTNPGIVDPAALRLAGAALTNHEIRQEKFDYLLDEARAGDVIYFDPPYVPLSKTANFSAYADGMFSLADQARLADVFRKLDQRGCLLALSNSDTPEVRKLYADFDISRIFAPRAISAKASTRGEVTELLIRNVASYPLRPITPRLGKRKPPT